VPQSAQQKTFCSCFGDNTSLLLCFPPFYLATVPPILHVERIHKEDYSCSVNFSVQFKPTEVTQEVINLGLSSLLVHFAPMSSSGVPSFYHEKVSAVRAPRHQRSRIWCTQGAFQPVALFYVDFVQGTNCEEKNLPPTFEIQRNSSLCVIFLRVFFFCDGTSIRERTLIYLPQGKGVPAVEQLPPLQLRQVRQRWGHSNFREFAQKISPFTSWENSACLKTRLCSLEHKIFLHFIKSVVWGCVIQTRMIRSVLT